MFSMLGMMFTKRSFELGFFIAKSRTPNASWSVLLFGQGKLAVYLSRKNRIHQKPGYDVVPILRNLLKSRISLDFNFYKAMRAVSLSLSVSRSLCSSFYPSLSADHHVLKCQLSLST